MKPCNINCRWQIKTGKCLDTHIVIGAMGHETRHQAIKQCGRVSTYSAGTGKSRVRTDSLISLRLCYCSVRTQPTMTQTVQQMVLWSLLHPSLRCWTDLMWLIYLRETSSVLTSGNDSTITKQTGLFKYQYGTDIFSCCICSILFVPFHITFGLKVVFFIAKVIKSIQITCPM